MSEQNKSFYQDVKEFHIAFNHPVSEQPTLLDIDRYTNRCSWLIEEMVEAAAAIVPADSLEFKACIMKMAVAFMDNAVKQQQKHSALGQLVKTKEDSIVEFADGLVDQLYFIIGTMVEAGVEPQEIFNVVQKANMAKLHSDGKPRFREDGKVLKPEGWQSPDSEIKEIIVNRINAKQ